MPSLLARVHGLFQFIKQNPFQEQLTHHLSEHFCPSGERAGITISTLGRDGVVRCDFATGFPDNNFLLGQTISLSQDRPGSEVLRTLQPMVFTHDDVKTRYKDFLPREFMDGFERAILMPICTTKIYGFACQVNPFEYDGFQEYVDCVRSILSFYESTRPGSPEALTLGKPKNGSTKLTPRQNIILDLIKKEMTNPAIARELGFSESLIRQETIHIYRKLGVNGRHDLVVKSPN